MTFILISGDPNTGKTNVCKKLRDMLDNDPSFGKPTYPKRSMRSEVLKHYEKNGKLIVLNSAADDNDHIKRLAEFIDDLVANNMRPDIIITAIRENGIQKSRMLALLEEAAKGTGNLAQYYNQNIANITSFALKSLGSHAFMLHLTNQTASGNALAQYWRDNANDAKRELDRIV